MGKLITSDTWYFAANLPSAAAERLKEGKTATLRFSGELNRNVEMTVDRIGPADGDRTLVVFSSNRYLTLTTLLRHQTVELVRPAHPQGGPAAGGVRPGALRLPV